MSNAGKPEQLRLGFLETVEVDGRGHVGGLLVTNQCGRPLEFQCTTPVKPNRTQEILYGTTLRPWLLGELIGGTLLERVSIKPDLIVTSDPDVLELRNHSSIPIACTTNSTPDESVVQLGGQKLRFHTAHSGDRKVIGDRSHLIPDQADLTEPLERVREALAETVRTVFAR
ncbi:MAG: hypothetical protein KDA96_16760 [Planctomycetaceae bacterium]|nr:hypothetical protein [Planctomycetaceae bacterium]